MHLILVVSDGTGGTAEQAVRAALTQFGDRPVTIERRAAIRSKEQALAVVREAQQRGGTVVHTIVTTDIRNALIDFARLHHVPVLDLIGPLLAHLAQQLSDVPAERPGLLRELNKAYFRRIEAVEFALRHDDGKRVTELPNAEITLLGVSRTFKTPLSIYLAYQGWRVANVPIILDLPVPETVLELPPDRVFGLTADPRRLALLRRTRSSYLGGATGDYADHDHVRREMRYARQFYARQPKWPVIDVTDRSIEEIATEIVRILRKHQIQE
ncbi:MAG: pyruvate, water dikinase regulatory protein [Planctomycetota bacterium]|jgi:regulator of PEP synthase PpsR (kinase-PPPase family)